MYILDNVPDKSLRYFDFVMQLHHLLFTGTPGAGSIKTIFGDLRAIRGIGAAICISEGSKRRGPAPAAPPGPQRRVPAERGSGAAAPPPPPSLPPIAPTTARAPRPTKSQIHPRREKPPPTAPQPGGARASPGPPRSKQSLDGGISIQGFVVKKGGWGGGGVGKSPTNKKQLGIAPESTVCSDPPLPAHLPRPTPAASGVINPFVSAQSRRWLSSSGQRFTCGNITSIPQPNHMHKGKQSCIKHGIYCLLASLLFLKSPLTGPNNCTFRLKEARGEEEKKN